MEDYDFEKIPLWNSDSPNFDILSDEVNGRIPVTRLECWKDFTTLLEAPFFNRPKTQFVFRGHRRFDWGLMPTLARIPATGIIDEALANSQLEHFRRAVRGRLSDNTLVSLDEEDELWAVGQHHGLLTPLLDWAYSPYVALFFAFAKEDSEEEKENPYRAVYVLNKTFVADDELCPDIRMFEPRKDDHGRLVNQAGLFTFSPYDSTIENKLTDTISNEEFEDDELRNAAEEDQACIIAKYICKIYIRNEDREGCMRHLRRMNVHHASLFPDLIGASEYCNLMVAEERREYEFDQAATRIIDSARAADHTQEEPPNIYVSDQKDVPTIASILDSLASPQVEPGRIQLIAEKLDKEIKQLQVVDWYKREPILAQIRSAIKITLRKLGYPASSREEAIMAILDTLTSDARTPAKS